MDWMEVATIVVAVLISVYYPVADAVAARIAARKAEKAGQEPPERAPFNWKEHFVFIGVVCLIIIVMVFLFRRTVVNGESMNNTLAHKQQLIVARTDYNPFLEPERGDIVVVESDAFDTMIIKRLIGLPGDEVRIRENQVFVNDVLLVEDYLPEPMQTEDLTWQLGENQYFVMGDNRNHSGDSRAIGPVTEEELYGIIIFDLSHFRGLARPETFGALD